MPTRDRRLAALAREHGVSATALAPLELTQAELDGLALLQEALREDTQLYTDVALFLERLQRRKVGPLTDALAALVGKEA